MGFRVSHYSSFRKDLKSFKNQRHIQDQIKTILNQIIENPKMGEGLEGNWFGFQKVSFSEKPEIRLIYRVYDCCQKADSCEYDENICEECEGMIDFLFIKTREECNNLYYMKPSYINQFNREA